MQDPWTIVGVVLLAVLVGATTPVLFQLYSTLRLTKKLLDRLGPKMDSTLTEVREAGQRLNRVGSGLERSTKRAQVLLEAAGDIGESVSKLRDSLKTATTVSAALGPAIAAAIGALTEMGSRGSARTEDEPREDESAEEE
jgi:ABC-type transporter Mla subunit MlaD